MLLRLLPLLLLRLGTVRLSLRLLVAMALAWRVLVALVVLVTLQMLRRARSGFVSKLRAQCLSQLTHHRLSSGDSLAHHLPKNAASLVGVAWLFILLLLLGVVLWSALVTAGLCV